jgi:hypothetical protein
MKQMSTDNKQLCCYMGSAVNCAVEYCYMLARELVCALLIQSARRQHGSDVLLLLA